MTPLRLILLAVACLATVACTSGVTIEPATRGGGNPGPGNPVSRGMGP